METINCKILGDNIRIAREDMGITQEFVMEACKLSKSYYSKLENGKALPSLKSIIRIANCLNVPVSRLIGGKIYKSNIPVNVHTIINNMTPENRIRFLLFLATIRKKHIDEIDYPYRIDDKGLNVRLTQFRVRSHDSKDYYAQLLGVSEKSYKNIESGNTSITFEGLHTISETKDVPIDLFLIDLLKNNVLAVEYILSQMRIEKVFKNKYLKLIVEMYSKYLLNE